MGTEAEYRIFFGGTMNIGKARAKLLYDGLKVIYCNPADYHLIHRITPKTTADKKIRRGVIKVVSIFGHAEYRTIAEVFS